MLILNVLPVFGRPWFVLNALNSNQLVVLLLDLVSGLGVGDRCEELLD